MLNYSDKSLGKKIGFQLAMEQIYKISLTSSPTLIDSLSQEAWDNWNGFDENPIVIDCDDLENDEFVKP